MRKIELLLFNKSGGYDNGICWAHNEKNDKSLEKFVINTAHWMLENATGECEIKIHINPSNCKIIEKGE